MIVGLPSHHTATLSIDSRIAKCHRFTKQLASHHHNYLLSILVAGHAPANNGEDSSAGTIDDFLLHGEHVCKAVGVL